MEKLFAFFEPLHNVFYGEQWYIAWGIVIGIILVAVGLHIPSFVRSVKAAKVRNDKK